MKDVMILTGEGQIGMAIARRMGYGIKIKTGGKPIREIDVTTWDRAMHY